MHVPNANGYANNNGTNKRPPALERIEIIKVWYVHIELILDATKIGQNINFLNFNLNVQLQQTRKMHKLYRVSILICVYSLVYSLYYEDHV